MLVVEVVRHILQLVLVDLVVEAVVPLHRYQQIMES
jgi:hypothetical protein